MQTGLGDGGRLRAPRAGSSPSSAGPSPWAASGLPRASLQVWNPSAERDICAASQTPPHVTQLLSRQTCSSLQQESAKDVQRNEISSRKSSWQRWPRGASRVAWGALGWHFWAQAALSPRGGIPPFPFLSSGGVALERWQLFSPAGVGQGARQVRLQEADHGSQSWVLGSPRGWHPTP